MNSSTRVAETPISKILAKSGSLSFLMNVAGVAIALLVQIVLARELGAENYGYYSYVMTVVTFLVFPAKLGFDTSIVRFFSSYKAQQLWGEVKGLLRRANQLSLLASALIAMVGLAVIFTFYRGEQGELTSTFVVGMLTVPLMALTTLRQSSLLALNEVMYAQLPEKILRPVLCIVLLYTFNYGLNTQAGAASAMMMFAVAMLLSYMFGAWVLYRKITPLTRTFAAKFETKLWVTVSASLMINAGMYLVLGQLNVVMLGIVHGTYESGIFSAAVRVATMISFAITSINMIAAPLISEQFAKKDMKRLQSICTLSARSGFAFAVLVFVGVLLGGKWILGLFGEQFQAGYAALVILSFTHLAHAFFGQCGTVMNMTGQQRTSTYILTVACGINIAGNVLLVPLYGMVGAALANLISALICYASMTVVVQRRLNLSTSVLAWRSKPGRDPS